MFKILLSGGIGSGKSVVRNLLSVYGFMVYDSDSRAKSLEVTSPSLRSQIVSLLGSEAYSASGDLNRAYIASMVFSNKDLLSSLEALVHPAVFADFNAFCLSQASLGSKAVVFETAVLRNNLQPSSFSHHLFVSAPLQVRISRVCSRDGLSPDQVRDRMRNQDLLPPPDAFVINNSGSAALIPQVDNFVRIVLGL